MKLAFAALLAGCLAGCAALELKPAPEANVLAQNAAIAMGGDVQLVARADAWQGMPPHLDSVLTPMLVTVTNDSAHAIRIDYQRLALVAPDGQRFAAIPPHDVSGSVTVSLGELGYGPGYAPPYGYGDPYAPGPSFWDPPYWRHPYWSAPYPHWSTTRPVWGEVRLPTVDMLRQALPDGVLEPGAMVTGFVYFQPLRGDFERLELRAAFPSAAGGEVTRLEIPFVLG